MIELFEAKIGDYVITPNGTGYIVNTVRPTFTGILIHVYLDGGEDMLFKPDDISLI